ncbi:androgen-dependent TFPI-regulating protein [Conger conger]|uniref:androgen-dependent TFPI-regulating protein n=1 Tax=Conger conger TaxID=82655 RepID=UPI002A5AC0C4|nr:androgen-dependent TFPI-regulating protein [Conger conger]
MAETLRKSFHILVFSWYAFVLLSLAAKDGEPLPPGIFMYGGPWKYLTFLNLVLQMVFFGLAAACDFQSSSGKGMDKQLDLCMHLLFSVLAFPVGLFVVLLFWTIFTYDRELVYPGSMDEFFPQWMNHAMHTLVLPLLLGEILLQPHEYPKTKNGLAALGIVGLAYLSWVIWIYLAAGIWVYPLLGLFSTPGLMGLFFCNMSIVTLLYMLGQTLNKQVWA